MSPLHNGFDAEESLTVAGDATSAAAEVVATAGVASPRRSATAHAPIPRHSASSACDFDGILLPGLRGRLAGLPQTPFSDRQAPRQTMVALRAARTAAYAVRGCSMDLDEVQQGRKTANGSAGADSVLWSLS